MNIKAQLVTPEVVYPCEIDLRLEPLVVKVIVYDNYEEILDYISNISHEFQITYVENSQTTQLSTEAIYLVKKNIERVGEKLI